MLGSGTFVTQNKTLPGAYFQFISKATATAALSNRGTAAMAMELNWGADGEIFTVEASEFMKNSQKIFGYDYTAEEMKFIRELFRHANTVHFYKLASNGVKASNAYATAVCSGKRGNDLSVGITKGEDEASYAVTLYLGNSKVDEQIVASAAALKDNKFVVWNKEAELEVTAQVSLENGTNGTTNAEAHQTFLNKLEAYPDVNAIGYMGTDKAVKNLYIAYAKRMRDEVGIKLQVVIHDAQADAIIPDSIAVVNVKNQADIIPWVTGVVAGTAVNKSATNMKYDGEVTVDTEYTKKALEEFLKAGEFVLHQVGKEVRVLEDINSLVSVTDEQGEVFKDNQTVRVIDSIATSIAGAFANKYLGKVPNDVSGRISLWSDIVKIHQQLNDIQAIENFESGDITVAKGDTKKAVVVNSAITIVNSMTKLYMKTVIA